MKKLLGVFAVVALVLLLGTGSGAGDKKPKYSIPEVMKKAHASKLWKSVADGEATQEQKEELVEYYTSLAASTPPLGDKAKWKARTHAMLEGAQLAAAGKVEGTMLLKKNVQCNACHKEHKPPEEE